MKNDLLVRRNEVVNASYRLSVVEQRILLTAIAKIPKMVNVSDEEIYTVSVEDLKSLGVHEKTAYRDLKEAVNRLYERSINITTGEGKAEKVTKMRWVQEIYSLEGTGVIGMRFSKPLLPFISNVKDNFTQYLLSEISQMQGVYSIRIYEFCKQYLNIGKRKIDIKELRVMLDLGSKYRNTGHLMDKVIGVSVKEINKLTSLNVKAKPLRTGRKYTHIEFIIKQKKISDNQVTEIDFKMTDKQRHYYGRKLANIPEISCRAVGASERCYEAFGKQISEELLEKKYRKIYKPYLTKLGFSL